MPDDEQTRLNTAYAAMASRHGSDYHSSDHPAVQWLERCKRDTVCSLLIKANRPILSGLPMLEIGCGSGGILPFLVELGATPEQLCGVDLQADRIEAARTKHPAMRFELIDAATLPFEDNAFDVVIAFTVFSSILAPERRWAVASEMRRVLAPGGLILWYDMRWPNPWNPHIRPVPAREVQALFPGFRADLRPHTLAPPLARRIAGRWPKLAYRLARNPLLCSHLMGTLRPG